MDAQQRRLDRLKPLIGRFLAETGAGFGIELWDGTVLPDGAAGGPRIAIADEGAFAALLKRPGLETVIGLHARGRLDLRGGDFFDLAPHLAGLRAGRALKTIGPFALARGALPFLRVPGGLDAAPGALAEGGTPDRNRRNIAFHYDVSNAFYALFLDPELVYSCAYFPDWDADIATAQIAKLDHICRKLRLRPGEDFLDVGCGWGALVCHAAERYGVRAHGITLSTEQLAHAAARVAERGLSDRVSLSLADWTTLDGRFDKIASVGMFEHVGIDNHPAYFRRIRSLLAPRGLYLHHAITRPGKLSERKFRRMRPEYKAIIRHIFPGAELDHIGLTARHLEACGFEVHDVEGLREHYARTTELWCRRLTARREEAVALVGEERTRLWIAYLAGVSLGFARGTINLFQTLASARAKGPSGLPPTRADLYR